MKAQEIRNWIGKYFLFTLSALGGYIYIFAETNFLPISESEAMAAGETIIPVFLGQLAIVYKWYFTDGNDKRTASPEDPAVPTWLVKGPPILAVILIVCVILMMILANLTQANWAPDPESFRRVVVFVVSMLNVTTIMVVSRYFPENTGGDKA